MSYPKQNLVDRSVSLFQDLFRERPHFVSSAPGRVNLIGEHTDYNEGFVLPTAIDRSILMAAGPRNDNNLVVYSDLMGELARFTLGHLRPSKDKPWTNYVCGVAHLLEKRGEKLRGANIAIVGDIPPAAGLSSSAALEIAAANAFMTLSGFHLPPLDIIELCQQAENSFVGVRCGIMDQFVCCVAKQNTAIFLDCRSLHYDRVSIPSGVKIVVCYTGVERALTSSEYNKRRNDCASGVKVLSSTRRSVKSLRDISMEELEDMRNRMDPVVFRRCRHVISENARVVQSVDSLKANNQSEFGKLMYQSHMSLRSDYEVSSPELDAVVDICAETEGVFGARMTGAGFGGSALCLVQSEAASLVTERLAREYPVKTGRQPTVFECTTEDGGKTLII